MAYDQSVRQLMTSAGYDPSKIGYDQGSGYVTYNGSNFIRPQKNYNGTTFTDQSTFDQAHNAFKASDPYSGSLFHPDTGGRSYEQNLGYWAQNHQAGMDEYNRANQAMSVYKALNDTAKMNDATQHIGRLQTILGINPNQSQQDTSVQNMLASIQQQLGSKTPYDVYSDPAYAAAQAQQQKQAQQAIMAGQEAMGTSGMARSSDLARYAQGQQNDANQYLMTQVVPQLMQQHNAQEQQKLQNMLSVLSPLMQEQQMNQQQKQQDWENRFNYGQSVGQFGNGQKTFQSQQADAQNAQWEQKFNEDVRQFGLQHALQQWQANQSAANAAADNARQNAALGLQQQQFDWSKDPNNPDNLYKASQINKNNSSADQPTKDDMSSQYISNIDQIPTDKLAAFFKKERANIVKDLGASGYNTIYNMYMNSDGTPKQ